MYKHIYIFGRKRFLVNFTSHFYFFSACEIFMKKKHNIFIYWTDNKTYFYRNQSPIVKFKYDKNFLFEHLRSPLLVINFTIC